MDASIRIERKFGMECKAQFEEKKDAIKFIKRIEKDRNNDWHIFVKEIK